MVQPAQCSIERSDESLMQDVQQGGREAFAILVQRHSALFFSAAYRMCSNQDEAEDIVQDSFLKLWKNPHGWDDSRGVKFKTWFYRVVTNQAIDYMRRKRPTQGGEALDFVADDRLDQQKQVEVGQEQMILESAIGQLPERQRVALNLCFYEGLSNKDAAEVMGVGVKALESLLMRAKSGLREALVRQKILSVSDGINKEAHYG